MRTLRFTEGKELGLRYSAGIWSGWATKLGSTDQKAEGQEQEADYQVHQVFLLNSLTRELGGRVCKTH